MIGAFSIWHWLIVIVWFIVPMFPISTILKKAGHSPWWALLYVVPLANLIALFMFAYGRWPKSGNAN